MLSLKNILLFVLILAIQLLSIAQESFRTLGPDQGLAGYETHDILQDNEGYIWIATDQGLSRYDGKSVKNFDTEDGLPDLVVLHLSLMPDGALLGITLSNRLFVCKGDSISVYPEEFKLLNRIRNQDIPQFLDVNSNSEIFYGGNQSGYVALNENNGENKGYRNNGHGIWLENLPNGLHYGAWLVDEDKSENRVTIILGDQGEKELIWEGIPFTTGPVRALKLANSNTMISYAGYLCLLDQNNIINSFNFGSQINALFEDSLGRIWLGNNLGLSRFGSVDELFSGSQGLNYVSDAVSAIHFDASGALWVGTLNEGIKYFPRPEIRICQKEEYFSWKSIRPLNNDQFISLNSNSQIIEIELSEEGINTFDLHGERIHAGCLSADGSIILANERGLFEYTGPGEWMPALTGKGPQHCKQALNLLSISDNEIGITERKGFEIIDKSTYELRYDSRQDGFTQRTYSLIRDSKGTLWIGTSSGFYRKGKSDFELIKEISGIPIKGRVEYMQRIDQDRIAIALKGQGLMICSGDMQSAILYTHADGLKSGIIRNLQYYEEYGLLVCGSKGMDRIKVNENSIEIIEHMDKWSGLPSNDVLQCLILGNFYWFVCPDGICRVPLNSGNDLPPTLHLQHIQVGNDLFFEAPKNAFQYEPGTIKISYTGFNYQRPQDLQYRYKLNVSDTGWNYTTATLLEFASLDPGKYNFSIQVGNDRNIWGETQELNFKIETPFWLTWWFAVLLFIIISGIIYLIVKWLMVRLRKGDIIEKKLVHLERSALLAQMNPHFIFNSLNSIQSYIANNENDKANRFLAKFSRLIRAMLNHSRSPKVTLHDEINSLELYLELEKMRFKEKFEYEITVDRDIDTQDIELPPLLIQPYLENAIIHGLAKKEGTGRIELFYMLIGKYLIATVTDNGIGIEKSKQLKENHGSLHKSVGMTITQKRLELLDENNKDSKVSIQEVKDRHGKVLGTKVEVKIRVIE